MKFFQTALKLILFFFFISCAEKKESEPAMPADVLGVDQMAEVVAHIHLSEAVLLHENLKPAEQRKQITIDVLGELNTTEKIYQNSLRYYSMHPDQLKRIHELALGKLNRMRRK